MKKKSPIFVAGHRGLAGTALTKHLKQQGYTNLITASHEELDLTDQKSVYQFFEQQKPKYVFIAAAKVGGIYANNHYPADFIRENLSIELNTIDAAYRVGVKRLLFLGSSCIYPRDCVQPMPESSFLTGPLEPTSQPYAVAKIAGVELCWSYNRQYNTQFLVAMPASLYGPGDNFHPEHSHIIPGLIRRFHEAKKSNSPKVEVWGTGSPLREYMHSDDMATACIFLMNLDDNKFSTLLSSEQAPLINIGSNDEISIKKLVTTIKEVTNYKGDIIWNTNKPDGMPRKLLDGSRMHKLGWQPHTSLVDGLKKLYALFSEKYDEILELRG